MSDLFARIEMYLIDTELLCCGCHLFGRSVGSLYRGIDSISEKQKNHLAMSHPGSHMKARLSPPICPIGVRKECLDILESRTYLFLTLTSAFVSVSSNWNSSTLFLSAMA